ncbi:AAA family ATPase [Patescibacteria group bacterium]|nr:AAA family ATPase [Patescibacteria group bacterium]
MNLVILYGPPASGKLTVAQALVKKTGYALLHNHLIADFASALFPYGTEAYANFSEELRVRAIKKAIEQKLPGLIMTFAYGLETKDGLRDNIVLKELSRIVGKADGKTTFVRLYADHSTLIERIGLPSRHQHKKLTNKKILVRLLKNYRLEDVVPFAESLSLQTDQRSALQSTKEIIKHLGQNI